MFVHAHTSKEHGTLFIFDFISEKDCDSFLDSLYAYESKDFLDSITKDKVHELMTVLIKRRDKRFARFLGGETSVLLENEMADFSTVLMKCLDYYIHISAQK